MRFRSGLVAEDVTEDESLSSFLESSELFLSFDLSSVLVIDILRSFLSTITSLSFVEEVTDELFVVVLLESLSLFRLSDELFASKVFDDDDDDEFLSLVFDELELGCPLRSLFARSTVMFLS